MPKRDGESMVLLQFRAPKKQADALALVQEANGKTEADVLRDALTWYLGSPHVHQQLKFGQVMRAVAEGRIDIVEIAERPGEVALMVPEVKAPCLCGSGKSFAECCGPKLPKPKGAA